MKIKQIIGAVLMGILTISSLLFGILLSIQININSKGVTSVINKTNYIEESIKDAKSVLENYLTEEKATLVLENINVKSHIYEMVETLENNTILNKSNEIKEEVKNEIVKVIDDSVEEKVKLEFAEKVSSAYIKKIFPVSEFNMLSKIYIKYSNAIKYMCLVLFVVMLGIYIYLSNNNKTYKWNIIAIYNTVLINIMIIIFTLSLNNISIGSVRLTKVIAKIISNVRWSLVIYTVILLVIQILSNYIAYFKKHSK